MAERWSGVAGKRVVLTGATGGIGLAAAGSLAARGAHLSIVARSPERAEQALGRIRAAARADATVDVLIADLSSQASVRALAAEVLERYDSLDVLANNAGAIYATRQLSVDGIELQLGGEPPRPLPPHEPAAGEAPGERARRGSSPPRRTPTRARGSPSTT